jgi:hypothetical protein
MITLSTSSEKVKRETIKEIDKKDERGMLNGPKSLGMYC